MLPVRHHALAEVLQHVTSKEDGQPPVLPTHRRWDELLYELHADSEALGHENAPVMLHQRTCHLTARDTEHFLVLLLLLASFRSVLLLLGRKLLTLLGLLGLAPLQRITQGLQGHLAHMFDLLGREDARSSLLQAGLNAIRPGPERPSVDIRGVRGESKLRKNPLQKLVDKLRDDLGPSASPGHLAELSPRFEGRIPDLLVH
mmetsp:Transcript_107305/g.301946  ORF Transcript_107305/g.301946 Transcript_107305/m.301946 type:complete len:202 (+) Transcript_107305:865-1470(+)